MHHQRHRRKGLGREHGRGAAQLEPMTVSAEEGLHLGVDQFEQRHRRPGPPGQLIVRPRQRLNAAVQNLRVRRDIGGPAAAL